MALIYITGPPGVGKSTIQELLASQGIECYDIDDSRFGGPHNKISGDHVEIPPAHQRTDDWFDHHEWRIYPTAFKQLKKQSKTHNIVVCGVAESDVEIVALFDKILYLKLDDPMLKSRLLTRTDNDYGKNASELSEIMRRKHALDERYKPSNAIQVDASGTIDDLLATLLTHISR